MNLAAYFERVGYDGPAKADLDSLRNIVFAHATSIPFESLDPLAGVPVSLKPSAIFDKLVTRKRGGYCFEQNALLSWALREVGFDVAELSARVWYNTPEGETPPRTHIFLAVTVDGTRWLADCGVGGSTPTGLMELDLIGEPQQLMGESRQLVPIAGRLVPTWMHQVEQNGEWRDVYEFTGETMPMIDQEMGNWWTSSHPDSKFRKNVIVALLNHDGSRISVLNNELVHRSGAKTLERVEISSRDELAAILESRFGLELPAEADVRFLFG